MSPSPRPGAQNRRWHRLSALDAAFLSIENERNPMHIGATTLYESGSWLDAGGRIDEARFLRYAEHVLTRLPKWRERLAFVPLFRHPVLVPDPDFDLTRHIRFVHLPGGTLRDVERVAGNVYSSMLDRSAPLWELIVIDELEGRRFASIIKLHHCMADGIAGLGALMAMLRPTPDTSTSDPSAELPCDPPTPRELLHAEIEWRASEPTALWQSARAAIRQPRSFGRRAKAALRGVSSAVRSCALPAPATPLNPRRVGTRRAYRGVRLDLEDVKRVRREAGVKLNDVVLATVAGALQDYFEELGVKVRDCKLRCMVPVSLHQQGSADWSGNEVSLMIIPLPIGRMPPRERLKRTVEWSRSAKLAGQSSALALGEHLADWTLAPLIPWAMRLVMMMRPYNLIVTNVPGPTIPFYLGDAKLIGIYPLVPLYGNQALAIALVSYDGSLFLGLNADPDRVRNLKSIGDALSKAFAALSEAYGRSAESRSADGGQPNR